MQTLVLEEMPGLFWQEIEKKGLRSYFHTESILFSENIEIIIIRTRTHFNASYFTRFPNLKLIIRAGTGVDNIDLNLAAKNHVTVCHTPEANAVCAFEQTISFVFSLIKQQNQMKQSVLTKLWKQDVHPNHEIQDLKVLVVGVGRIGTRVAQLLQQLGAQVRGVDPYLTSEQWTQKGIPQTTYVSGLKWCNLLTFHCPLTDETTYYFSPATLALLGEPIWLINTSRGAVVQEEAIQRGFEKRLIRGVGLDVFEEEPWEPADFAEFPNVLLSPHAGAYTDNAKSRLALETLEAWEAFVHGRGAIHVVET